ncbi:MAG: hypothetical protein V1763_01715, partial [Parcubacteria group bacterium]
RSQTFNIGNCHAKGANMGTGQGPKVAHVSREFVEFMWKGTKHMIKKELLNGQPGAVRLPDGTLLDRSLITTIDEFGEYTHIERDPVNGSLPVMAVVDAVLAGEEYQL